MVKEERDRLSQNFVAKELWILGKGEYPNLGEILTKNRSILQLNKVYLKGIKGEEW